MRKRKGLLAAFLCFFLISATARAVMQEPQLTKEQMKEFLLTAKVVKSQSVPKGITGISRLVLSAGKITHEAAFQSIDESKLEFQGRTGKKELSFRDTLRGGVNSRGPGGAFQARHCGQAGGTSAQRGRPPRKPHHESNRGIKQKHPLPNPPPYQGEGATPLPVHGEQGEMEKARAFGARALEMARQYDHPAIERNTLMLLADAALDAGDAPMAEGYLAALSSHYPDLAGMKSFLRAFNVREVINLKA